MDSDTVLTAWIVFFAAFGLAFFAHRAYRERMRLKRKEKFLQGYNDFYASLLSKERKEDDFE